MSSIRIFLLTLFLLSFLFANAQEGTKSISYDSSLIDTRSFDQEKLEKLKADPDMDYGRSPAAINLWERFKIWLSKLFSRLLTAVDNANWFNILLIILAIIGLVYVILRLLKVDAFTMFYAGKKTPVAYGVLDEDIHAMDFDKLIREALTKKEFRLAIRLLFLQSLKLLADKHHILWQPGKTNHDYLDELAAQQLKTGFNELNFYFEYAWYGNFTINESLYQKVDSIFKEWKTNV